MHPSLKEEFINVKDLRDALTSNEMYTFPVLYDRFCSGMESGKLRGMEELNTHKPLTDMLSSGYEAHFRCELSWAAIEQGYRHSYKKESTVERAGQFKIVLANVKEDRATNGAAAWEVRKVSLPEDRTTAHADDSDADAEANGGVVFGDDEF